MKGFRKKLPATFIGFFTSLLCVSAQDYRISDHNSIGWYSVFVQPSLSKHWGLHLEYQWRRIDVIKYWQQSLLRTGVNYKLSDEVTLQAGYTWAQTFNYGDYTVSSIAKSFPEHRLHQLIEAKTKTGKIKLMQRLRLEQRWLGRYKTVDDKKVDHYEYANRVRYQFRTDVPLGKSWYAAAYDEIFIGFGKNVNNNVFDQNRIGILAGKELSKTFRIEGGYLNVIQQLGREIDNKNIFQYNTGFIINVYFTPKLY